MEFYENLNAPKRWLTSFNSQRDGILPYKGEPVIRWLEFQFPTGWNSTFFGRLYIEIILASFNSQRDGILPMRATRSKRISIVRFNSQRDGILLCLNVPLRIFPIGFNSQRDGILHYRHDLSWRRRQFQFPTGWNSTSVRCSRWACSPAVSIPNGMEFYSHSKISLWSQS